MRPAKARGPVTVCWHHYYACAARHPTYDRSSASVRFAAEDLFGAISTLQGDVTLIRKTPSTDRYGQNPVVGSKRRRHVALASVRLRIACAARNETVVDLTVCVDTQAEEAFSCGSFRLFLRIMSPTQLRCEASHICSMLSFNAHNCPENNWKPFVRHC